MLEELCLVRSESRDELRLIRWNGFEELLLILSVQFPEERVDSRCFCNRDGLFIFFLLLLFSYFFIWIKNGFFLLLFSWLSGQLSFFLGDQSFSFTFCCLMLCFLILWFKRSIWCCFNFWWFLSLNDRFFLNFA